jgi:hypothetical protein
MAGPALAPAAAQENPFHVADLGEDPAEPPAHWRNGQYEPQQPGRPRPPRLPALGGGFVVHHDGAGWGDDQRHVRNRRAITGQAIAEGRDGAMPDNNKQDEEHND